MKASQAPERRRIGRPLSFDRGAALEKAMLAFWRHGYETTSVADLTAAMGITAPSLYAAFGDKKRLFLEAMRLYAGAPSAIGQTLEAAPSARDAARDMLVASATAFTGETTPKGCLLASAAASGSAASADVQSAVSDVRRSIAEQLRRRIGRDIAAGALPGDADAAALSDLVIGTIQGMSVLARDGVPRDRLLRMADYALRAWPSARA